MIKKIKLNVNNIKYRKATSLLTKKITGLFVCQLKISNYLYLSPTPAASAGGPHRSGVLNLP